jgi:hypothetical protein
MREIVDFLYTVGLVLLAVSLWGIMLFGAGARVVHSIRRLFRF